MSLAAVSQVASSIGGLKSRYLKYLEAFCAANGVEVADVKVCAVALSILHSLSPVRDTIEHGGMRETVPLSHSPGLLLP